MGDQLDLIKSAEEEVPQANSLALLIQLIRTVLGGCVEIDALAESLDVDERTVRYYIDLGRWLGMLNVPEPNVVGLTSVGRVFADNPKSRSRLFRDGMFLQELVQSIHALKREDEELSTRDAAEKAILATTTLAPSTARRRASSVTTLLEAAYRPSEFDWETGDKVEVESPVVSFDGRAFLTTMAARSFGASSAMSIGFPKQVVAFMNHEPMRSSVWRKAALDDDGAHWFGSVPINETTISAAKRGGRDLRNLLALCVPAVTLTLSLLNWRDVAGRPIAHLTQDMYGLRIWIRGKDYGPPIDLMAMFAKAHEIVWNDAPSKVSSDPLSEPATNQDLVDILVNARFCHVDGTTIQLIKQFEFESREAAEGSSSTHDRLGMIEPMWQDVL